MADWPPAIFAVTDPAELDGLLAKVGLGTMVTQGPDGFLVTHMPFVHIPAENVLRGHLSLANPHAKTATDGTPTLVTFHALDAYITPSLYPGKAIHGKVAPTWNYEFLHVHGPVTWHRDAAWLERNLNALTDKHEAAQPTPWKVDDAPREYTDKLLTQIIGVEIAIDRIDCRRKMNQNRQTGDQQGVISGLSSSPDPNDQRMAAAMAALK